LFAWGNQMDPRSLLVVCSFPTLPSLRYGYMKDNRILVSYNTDERTESFIQTYGTFAISVG